MIEPLVTLILVDPGMAERIVDAHVDDGAGRCSRCVVHNRPAAGHPCIIRMHALYALTVREIDRPEIRGQASDGRVRR